MKITPSELRQIILVAVAIPVILVWVLTAVVWVFTHDITGLTITTPLMIGLLTFATGFTITRKVSNGSE